MVGMDSRFAHGSAIGAAGREEARGWGRIPTIAT